MNKLSTARLLMAISILLIILFQAYWMRKLYYEEKEGFERKADVIFRESIYRLQADRLKSDTMIFRGIPEDNLFMSDVVDAVKKSRASGKDSAKSFVISLNTNIKDGELFRDSAIHFTRKIKGDPPPNIIRFLKTNKMINDTIPVKRVDSLYSILLEKEKINVPHTIHFSGNGSPQLLKGFTTKQVPVGLVNPLFYSAVFNDSNRYILKNISTQFLLSVLLIVLTTVSFIFIYRNLVAQRKLTAIKNEFIGNVTHELKTPIATVSVAIEAMKNFNVLENPDRTREYLGIAGQELNRLSLLVDKVLRLSMFENKQVELKYEQFDLMELIREVNTSMQLQFEKCQADVSTHVEGRDFVINADRMHIMSVIYNLLDNAIKYCIAKPFIMISAKEDAGGITMIVKDNGVGIDPAYIDRVFEKFFRVPHGNMHNVKGYGLGLSYAAHIIQRHGGSIRAESDGRSGTAFIINLPRKNGN